MASDFRLKLPDRITSRSLSDPGEAASVRAFVEGSPDRTVYHSAPYMEFAAHQNGWAELALISRDGNPQFAVPLHPATGGVTTGYSGIIFPAAGESGLKRAVRSLAEVVRANPNTRFEALGAAQAPGYDDRARTNLLQALLEGEGLEPMSFYSRVLRLPPDEPGASEAEEGKLDCEALIEGGLEHYDGDLRNQLRQAVRRGTRIEFTLAQGERREPAYARFHELHVRSWQRTGMAPHDLDYWLRLSRAVVDGGGRDLLVFALAPDGEPVAAVNCHLFSGRALYWAGCSSPAGLPLRANPLCLHAAIRQCAALGAAVFELGRMSPRERSAKERAITAYKSQFGGELVRLTAFETRRARRLRAGEALRALGAGVGARARASTDA